MCRIEGRRDGLGFVMKERIARPSIVAMALLVAWLETAASAAQPPDSDKPATTTDPTTRAHRAALPASTAAQAINPAARQNAQPLPPSLPSTVSPDIERFVSRSGRDLPPSSAPRAIGPVTRAGGQPTPPSLPSTVSPDIERFAGRNGRDLHSPSPAVASRTGLTARSSGPAPTPPSPLATTLRLKAAPFDPNDVRFPINLATALRLSDARPLIVAAAQARVWVAEAELTQAKVLWIPALNVAFDYLRHDGGGPDFNKGIMTTSEHELLLRRWRPVGGSSPRPMPSTSPWRLGRS